MTDRRATITRNWRPTGSPARRIDDTVEVLERPQVTAEQAPARQIERRSIGRRLENWGAWANMDPSRGGGGSSDSMTNAFCREMREYERLFGKRKVIDTDTRVSPPAEAVHRIDVLDAERINCAFPRLPEMHRAVLQWTYVVGAKSWAVAGACGFPSREYDARLVDAQQAIEAVVGPQNS